MSSKANTSQPGCLLACLNKEGSPEPQALVCAVVGGRGRVSPLIPLLVATWALVALTGCIPPPIDGCTETLCDDDNSCTVDTCRVIDGVPTCFITPIECNIGECDPETGDCVIAEDCDDDDLCTDDSFDEATGECVNAAIECRENLVCDPATGDCVTNACDGVDCEDGDLCTIDSCDPVAGVCANERIECGAGVSCDPETGECCDDCFICEDDDPCTDNTWDPVTGACINAPLECPPDETCDPDTGECVTTQCTTNGDCDDDNPCTSDQCDTITGECTHTEVVCEDDDLFCNGVPKCRQYSGECVAFGSCDYAGSCDEATDSCVDPLDNEQCLSQCEAGVEDCDERPLEEFPNFEETLIEMLEHVSPPSCDFPYTSVIAARCQSAELDALVTSLVLFDQVNFYDQQTGRFVAQRMWTDVFDDTCGVISYWPSAVDCDSGIVTEVYCGSRWSIGDEIDLRCIWCFDNEGP